ncbi:Pyroglutamyl-peptidase I [Beutenbergia cavernae DSM 12333]|uniref:Pyroglutamyl-peptidase I n=1 Tax=Beutenbergia cavernae (strain ATCC BAA-8 / DSM 12333 / CCUG 43141 / JCM 11478 / NBRC 16432 / NCIMB 13614 / HKI 0122) TaxID=471853 RepID=C5BV56_BEUC1|nr:pyroglutamyl-peptidase I [Beutenbergia cavernae]ACQ80443.1 Pyroglutamyl-peptidase I [Beutenbergia cavernae DSM 12333]
MTTILLTGFEPFGGASANASWDAVRHVAHHWDAEREGARLVPAELPCTFAAVGPALADLVARHQPDLLVATGVATGRRRVSLERVGLNLVDARIPDNEGRQPIDEPVDPDGPPARFTSLPVKAALVAARDAGLPVELSTSAGTFVCNAALYLGVGLAEASGGRMRAGFVHVPATPADGPGPSLPVDATARCLTVILRACVAVEHDLAVPGGTLA